MQQEPLQGLTPERLSELAGIELVDARRIVSLVHRLGALPARCPATVRRLALDAVRRVAFVPTLEIADQQASQVDPFVKLAVRLADTRVIETVRIPLERAGRYTVCVSSQAGCALACAFCATGRLGLGRNLEAWEIVEQVRLVRAGLPEGGRVHGVVFQGMGEPLANVERVLAAIRVLGEPSAQAIDQRNITVCTAGLPSGIRRLAAEAPNVRLGLSIGDVRPGRRRALLPIDDSHPLEEVLDAAAEHARTTRLGPMWAVALLAGVNDQDEAAIALAARARRFAEEVGVRPTVRLIPYNEVDGAGFTRPSDVEIERFRSTLLAHGVGSIVRYSGGGDVAAACGQLARPEAGGKLTRLRALRRPAGSQGSEELA